MSPTVFRGQGYRFYFFSREESRKHVHVHGTGGEAKFWLEPEIRLAKSYGFSSAQLAKIEKMVEEHHDEFINAWDTFFGA